MTRTGVSVIQAKNRAVIASLRNTAGLPPSPVIKPSRVIRRAVGLWKASEYDGSQTLKDLNRNGLDARLGSGTGVDTADPKYLDYKQWGVNPDGSVMVAGGDHLGHPGTVGNYASAPDDPRLDIGGDIDIRWFGALGTLGDQYLVSKFGAAGNQSFLLHISAGNLRLLTSANGTLTLDAASTFSLAASGVATGTPIWLRATRDVDNGSAGNTTRFYRSQNGFDWVEIGNSVITAGVTSIFNSTALLEVGSGVNGTTGLLSAGSKTYRAQVFASINGTDKRADVRFDKPLKWNNGQHTDSLGNTWTINRSAFQNRLKVVPNSHVETVPLSGNHISTINANELDVVGDIDLRARIALDDWTPAAETHLVTKFGSSASWAFNLAPNGVLRLHWRPSSGAGPYIDSQPLGITDGSIKWVRVTLDVDNGAAGHTVTFFTSDDGMAWTQVGSSVVVAGVTDIVVSAAALRVGSDDQGSTNFKGKIYEAQVWKGIPGISASARLVANPKFTALTTYAPHKEPSYLGLPGAGGAYASAPDSADLDITGDIDIRWHGALDDWTPAAIQTLVAKENGADSSYLLYVLPDGKLRLRLYSASATSAVVDSTASVPAVNGESLWVRVTWDEPTGTTLFYTSVDGVTWTQLGLVGVVNAALLTFVSTAPLKIGATGAGTTELATGRVHRVIIKNVIDGAAGSTVFDASFGNLLDGQASFVEVTGKTVTVAGTARIERRTWTFTRAALATRAELRTGRYAYLPGATGNYLSTPDAIDLDIAGDIDVQARLAMDDWTPASLGVVVSKWNSAGGVGTRSYALAVEPSGSLTLYISTDGGNAVFAPSTVPVGASDGAYKWVRATRVSETGVFTYYTSDDGVTWTQLGATTSSTSGSIFNSNRPLTVGADSLAASPLEGKVDRVFVKDGINGTIVASFDIADAMLMPVEPHNFFTDLYQNVWTISRAASGRKTAVVTEPTLLLGTDDYMETPHSSLLNFGLNDSLTLVAVYRVHHQMTAQIIGSYTGTIGDRGVGMQLTPAPNLQPVWSDGAVQDNAGGVAGPDLGARSVAVVQRDVAQDRWYAWRPGKELRGGGAIDTATQSLESIQPFRIGRRAGAGGNHLDGEFIGAAAFREALTNAEIAEVVAEFNYDPELVGIY